MDTKSVNTKSSTKKPRFGLTAQIFIGMTLGTIAGIILNNVPDIYLSEVNTNQLALESLEIGGKIFLSVLQMLVVPIVFVSLVCGTCSLDSSRRFGRLAIKTIFLYVTTTAAAIALAIFIASIFKIGTSGTRTFTISQFDTNQLQSFREIFLNIFPSNPIQALAQGNMMQIIVFAVLLGIAITWAKERGQRIRNFFQDFDAVIIELMHIVLKMAPVGVFCLVAGIMAKVGWQIIIDLLGYFSTMLFILGIQLFVVYASLLYITTGLSPLLFFKKMASSLLFAFSTSSSSASIPVVLEAVEHRLGIKESVAAFIIPLGATVNMAGTAIMQGVATVFIANTYGIDIGISGFVQVVITATIASIGTAGIPAVGMITLTMVLTQVGLPIEGISLILGVDRLLDMSRTAVNVSGDAIVACIVAKSEDSIDIDKYNNEHHVVRE